MLQLNQAYFKIFRIHVSNFEFDVMFVTSHLTTKLHDVPYNQFFEECASHPFNHHTGLYQFYILSSQSAVGILTLGWKDTSYKDVVSDIKKRMNILKQKDIPTQIDWTPGHSAIAGNEIADHLAKEAAKEAETFTDNRKFTSIADVKMASKKYVISLWQKRWDNSDIVW